LSCSDGNACTTGDSCQAGVCVGGAPRTCVAFDQCHAVGVCDPTSGACSNPVKADGSSCNDGNACTKGDQCLSGVCTMGTPTICAAADQCHAAGVCDAATGACSNPVAPPNTACNDLNPCTTGDVCQQGVCGGTPKTCAAADQCHAAGICDATTGACSNPPVAAGTACNDGNACTTVDTCQNGSCVGGSPKTCTASDQCHAPGTCDATTGTCSNPNAVNGIACNDGNGCTSGETCSAGACTGGSTKSCTASGTCHVAGVCQPTTGTCTDPVAADGASCDDGNMCSLGDACKAGVCTPSSVLLPTHCLGDGICDQCTVDNCVPSTDGCDAITDPADKALCEAVYGCFTTPSNACVTQGDPLKCWCGSNPTTCVTSNNDPTKANGVCLSAVIAAARLTPATYDAATIKQRFVDPSYPLGRAVNLTSCRGSFCNVECSVP
jgi:hypothetical protein